MSDLLVKPGGSQGKVHSITPASAGWKYVGFSVYNLTAGDYAQEQTLDREVILVMVEGKASITANGTHYGELGERISVFEQLPPHCLYIPGESNWQAQATTDCVIAVCHAPAKGGHTTRLIEPDSIQLVKRGKGANTRYIHNIAMEQHDIADSLLVTEVFTPQGNWSSYPPHRHDSDQGDDLTYLEETYYHRLNPPDGFAYQRVFTEDGELDENIAVSDGDVVLVPKGHHPCGAPYGYDLYYLNVMAGPVRKWRFHNHPDFDWIYQRDSASVE